MKSVLDVSVSCFRHCQAPNSPKAVNLLTWLTSGKYWVEQQRLRTLALSDEKRYKEEKTRTLPAMTPMGECTRRENNAFTNLSGLFCVDVDFKDNAHVINFHELKREFCKIKNVAYCGLSLSGNGYFLLIPIAEPARHAEYFEIFRELFAQWSINIDKQCGDLARLRIYSYDAEAYFNHQAEAVRLPLVMPKVAPKTSPVKRTRQQPATNTEKRVEGLIEQLHQHNIDITSDYRDWLKIGCSLAHEFGENGRYYFHQISELNPQKYDHAGTDKQYNKILQAGYSNATIASLFYLCDQYGVRYQTDSSPAVSTSAKQEPVLKPSKSGELESAPSPNGYPPSWDAAPDAKPSKLVPSPRRKEWSQLLSIPESDLNLYTLKPVA